MLLRLKQFVATALLLLLASCTKPCRSATRAADTIAAAMSVALACSDYKAIQEDLRQPIDQLKLCERKLATGVVGSIVCPPVAKHLVTLGVASLPARWSCKGGIAAKGLENFVAANCKRALTLNLEP